MTTSSPNDDVESEVSGPSSVYYDENDDVNVYVIRLTPQGKYTLEELKSQLLDPVFENDLWVLAVEKVPKEHYHIVIETDLDLEDLRSNIRSFLFTYWPEGQRPRGWGNAQYNVQEAHELTPEDVEIYGTRSRKAAAYALKDRGDYLYNLYELEWIQECIELSFSKKSVKTFKTEYQDLCDLFASSHMDVREFMVKYIQLKSKYGQLINVSHAYGYALSNLIRRDPNEADEVVESFLYKI